MSIQLDLIVHNGWKEVSGGNYYNLDLVDHFAHAGSKISIIPFDKATKSYSPNPGCDFILIDSILSYSWDIKDLEVPCIGLIHLPQSFIGDAHNVSDDMFCKEHAFFAKLDACIFVSEQTRRQSIKYFNFTGPSCVIEPGRPQKVELGKDHWQTSPTLRLLNVGRLDENKNQASLIDILAAHAKKFPQQSWTMTFCGPEIDEYYERRMYPKILEHGLEDRISWKGPIKKDLIHNIYRNADCYICSSKYESWGISIMEAMGHGLALINCSEGGAMELTDLARGIQLESPLSIGQCLKRLSDPQNLAEAKRNSLSGFQKLKTWPKQVQKLLGWLETLNKNEVCQ